MGKPNRFFFQMEGVMIKKKLVLPAWSMTIITG
jgi:hypothetical protein